MTAVHGPEVGEQLFLDPHPLKDSDRRLILSRFVKVARENGGVIDPNLVRRLLTDHNGDYIVSSRAVSGAYSALHSKGITVAVEPTRNTDVRGGNRGKLLNRWKVIDWPALTAYLEEQR